MCVGGSSRDDGGEQPSHRYSHPVAVRQRSHHTRILANKSREALVELVKRFKYDGMALSKHLKVSRRVLFYYLRKRHGISLRPKLNLHTDIELQVAAAEAGTTRKFQQMMSYSIKFIRATFDERGLEWPFTKGNKLDAVDPEVMKHLYYQSGFCWQKVADRLGVHCQTVLTYLDRVGLSVTVKGSTKYPFIPAVLRRLHVDEGYSTSQIALGYRLKFGGKCTPKTVCNALRRFGIPVMRRNGYANIERDRDGRVLPKPPAPIPDPVPSDEAWIAEPMAEPTSDARHKEQEVRS